MFSGRPKRSQRAVRDTSAVELRDHVVIPQEHAVERLVAATSSSRSLAKITLVDQRVDPGF